MSLSASVDFNEAATTSAEFNAQKIVQANSTVLSADANTLVEKALRRTRYLLGLAGTLYEYTFDSDATPPAWELVTATGAGFVGSPYGETFDLAAGTAYVEVPGCEIGDTLEVSVCGSAGWVPNNTGNWALVRAIVTEDFSGTPAVSNIDAAKALIGTAGVLQNFSLAGAFTTTAAGTTRVTLQAAIIEAPDELKLLSSLRIYVRKYRG